MGKLPTALLRRPIPSFSAASLPSSPALAPARTRLPSCVACACAQVRHATFVPRPRRPYTFTQLVQLSDGSTFTVRTTMPTALYKSAKDSRNHILWQPSEKSLRNVEVDEAGKLAAFRERFGRGWDLDAAAPASDPDAAPGAPVPAEAGKEGAKKVDASAVPRPAAPVAPVAPLAEEDPFDSLVDLISQYSRDDPNLKGGKTAKEAQKAEADKKKK